MRTDVYLGKQLRQNEIAKGYGLSSGKVNPWDLPEFQTSRQNALTERDIGLSDYVNKLTRSGVEGPGAALALEKYGQGFGNNLFDYANKLRTGYVDRGLNLGKQARDEQFQEQQAWLQQHAQRQAQPNDFTKWMSGINSVMDTIGKGAEMGFGAAGLMGKLPSAGGQNLESIIKVLQRYGIDPKTLFGGGGMP